MEPQNKLFTILESDKQTIPKTLESVIKHIEEHAEHVTENLLLLGVMYTLMLECGYCLSTSNTGANSYDGSSNSIHDEAFDRKIVHQTISFSYQNVLSQSDSLSKNILTLNETLYKVHFELLGIAEYSFLLMMIPSGRQTVVNLVVFENNGVIDCYSVAFTPASVISMIKSPHVALKFNNLRDFSILFRNNIALKGRSLVLNCYKSLNNSLEGMPVEILLKIIKYLTIDDQEKVASLSSTLYSKTSSFLSAN